MKNYRIILFGILIAFLAIGNSAQASGKRHVSTTKHKKLAIKKSAGLHSIKHKKHVKPNNLIAKQNQPPPHKPLDLAVHFTDLQAPPPVRQIAGHNASDNEFFDNRAKKRQSPLQVQGQVVLSQEPEADKRKSVDGAGIMINLRQ